MFHVSDRVSQSYLQGYCEALVCLLGVFYLTGPIWIIVTLMQVINPVQRLEIGEFVSAASCLGPNVIHVPTVRAVHVSVFFEVHSGTASVLTNGSRVQTGNDLALLPDRLFCRFIERATVFVCVVCSHMASLVFAFMRLGFRGPHCCGPRWIKAKLGKEKYLANWS